MEQKTKRKSIFLKLIEDKRAVAKCMREGGDLKKLAEERGIKFAKPI